MTVMIIGDDSPEIGPGVFVAANAIVIGRVSLGAASSVWYGSVLRGDDEAIIVGEASNVQDGCIIHADPGFPVAIGNQVTVGHRAVVHGATVEDGSLIGMGAIVLNGAHVGAGSMIGAGAVIAPAMRVPHGSVVFGVPGRVRRLVTAGERAMIGDAAAEYVAKARRHQSTTSEALLDRRH